MDWIKIKTKHVLFNSMTPTSIGYLVRIQALTSHLERMPNDKEIKQICPKNALTLIQKQLQFEGKTLNKILIKVLEDVKKIEIKRAVSRATSSRNYHKMKNSDMSDDMSCDTSQPNDSDVPREEKIREDKRRKEKNIKKEGCLSVIGTDDDYIKIQNIWNNFAKANGLESIIKLTQKRIAGIKMRGKEREFDLQKILDKISQSDFLRGLSKGKWKWKVNFEWIFCSPNNYLKILEGNFDIKIQTAEEKLAWLKS